ncbi:PREDICTED: endochitinase 2-like [Branchiostoma belcheri]|uniref:Endochitinase 2-like n=1 Tax=Branchiostoma belcheri TaxID=7741 RepID=A0A6P4ZQG0_BRABE|nr:PREDICTED: endochitinase 2-like [Branchiostoma belcheri]
MAATSQVPTSSVATTSQVPTPSVAATSQAPTSSVATTSQAPTLSVAATSQTPTPSVAATSQAPTPSVAATSQAPTSSVATTSQAPTSSVATTFQAPTSSVAATSQAPTSSVATTSQAPTSSVAATSQAPTSIMFGTDTAATSGMTTTDTALTTGMATTLNSTATGVVATSKPTEKPVTTKAPVTEKPGKPEKILAFSLSLDGNAAGLANKSSSAYRTLEQQCLTDLRPVYDTQPGFKDIRILGFRPGSIIVRHIVIFDSEDAPSNDEIMNAVENIVLNGTFSIANYSVEPASFTTVTLTSTELAELGEAELCTTGCGADALCNLTTIYGVLIAQCVCEDDYCRNGGQCEIIPQQGPKCSCVANSFVYHGGERCELNLPQTVVIGVGAGVGGGLLFIIIVLVGCLCCSRSRRKDDLERTDQGNVWLASARPVSSMHRGRPSDEAVPLYNLGKNTDVPVNVYDQQNSDSPQNNLARASRLTGYEFNYLKGELTTFQEGDEHNPNRQWNPTVENVPTKKEFKLPRPKVSSGETNQNRYSAYY